MSNWAYGFGVLESMMTEKRYDVRNSSLTSQSTSWRQRKSPGDGENFENSNKSPMTHLLQKDHTCESFPKNSIKRRLKY